LKLKGKTLFDINFFQEIHSIKKEILNGKIFSKSELMGKFENARSSYPVIYNIETTNACNMHCRMCPRTTMMTRSVETLPQSVFLNIVDQIKPHSQTDWARWVKFVNAEYNIHSSQMSENHFYLLIIPKVIQLHGYGDPLLDVDMPSRISYLKEKGIESYFSCNPANIDVDLNSEMMKSGLNYIKYSIESVDDFLHKEIRGEASDFLKSFEKINKLLSIKKKKDYKTIFIITMLNLGRKNQLSEFAKLEAAFGNSDVYIYLKSQDQQWYEDKDIGTDSIHWTELCMHPWHSMTIKSNGEAAMCMEDFNNEIILGDATELSLSGIWNGEKYREFRKAHFEGANGLKCKNECDMPIVGNFLKKETQ